MAEALVTIAVYSNQHDAGMARSLLEGSGIPAVLLDEYSVGLRPLHVGLLGGIKLQVPAASVAEARRLLAGAETANEPKLQTASAAARTYSKLVWIKPVLAALFAALVYYCLTVLH